jgi:uncharacterized protein (DUF2267 family)
VDHDDFIALVERGARAERAEAEAAARATLQTLGERIDAGQARDVAGRLPPELAPWLGTVGGAEAFDAEEFVRRVAAREDADRATAERHARAVVDALARAIGEREMADLAAELSMDFAPLLPRGRRGIGEAEAFVRRVADRAESDHHTARRATEAVLETLGERIAGGEVEDLLARLPIDLHAPLKRGARRRDAEAPPMPSEAFVWRVAEREGTTGAVAQDHTRAVLATLREAVRDDEFFDVTVQLPRDYAELLRSPAGGPPRPAGAPGG